MVFSVLRARRKIHFSNGIERDTIYLRGHKISSKRKRYIIFYGEFRIDCSFEILVSVHCVHTLYSTCDGQIITFSTMTKLLKENSHVSSSPLFPLTSARLYYISYRSTVRRINILIENLSANVSRE